MSLLRFAAIRKAGFIIALMLAGAYMLMTLLGPNGVSALYAQQQELEALRKENAELNKLKDELKQLNHALHSDAETQELIIRKKTGKTKKGDIVVIIEGADSNENGPVPSATTPNTTTPSAESGLPTLLP
jgi:cell division protein FtsB